MSKIFNVSHSYIMSWMWAKNPRSMTALIGIDFTLEHFGRKNFEVMGTRYSLNEKSREKLLEYAKDLHKIESYIDKESYEELRVKETISYSLNKEKSKDS